ncbi:MAG: hypothetical protein HY644_12990 [Acidobacteria bacterium]|nr:hypothetical protein [Acidobacteriota bacterium]
MIYHDTAYRTAEFLKRKYPGQSVYVWRSPFLAVYFLSGARPVTRFLFWRHLTRRPVPVWIEQQWRKDLAARSPHLIVNSDSSDLSARGVPFMNDLIRRRYRPIRKLQALTLYELIDDEAPEPQLPGQIERPSNHQQPSIHAFCCGSQP